MFRTKVFGSKRRRLYIQHYHNVNVVSLSRLSSSTINTNDIATTRVKRIQTPIQKVRAKHIDAVQLVDLDFIVLLKCSSIFRLRVWVLSSLYCSSGHLSRSEEGDSVLLLDMSRKSRITGVGRYLTAIHDIHLKYIYLLRRSI
jgi:hypothetical protein